MRLAGLILLLLAGCSETTIIPCPPSGGWNQGDRDRLFLEEHAKDFRERYPETARALEEYESVRPDVCLRLSGLRPYE